MILFSIRCSFRRILNIKNIRGFSFYHLFAVYLLMFSEQVISSPPSTPTCDKSTIEKELVFLGLAPTSKNNGELIKDIKHKYNDAFLGALTEQNMNIKQNEHGLFSVKELDFVADIGFKETFSPGVAYFLSPFNTPDNQYGADLLLETLLPYIYPRFRARLIVLHEMQLNALKKRFTSDVFVAHMNFFLEELGVEEDELKKVSATLFNTLFDEENYISANQKNRLKNLSGHHVNIIGYSLPGNDELFYNGVKIHYKIVVETLITMKIPVDVIIDLQHDYAGVGEGEKETKESKNKLKLRFLNKDINSIWGDEKTSYAYKFSAELYRQWPEFIGSIKAYTGEIVSDYSKGFIRDPNNDKNLILINPINAVGVLDHQENLVLFDKFEMTVEYKKNDF